MQAQLSVVHTMLPATGSEPAVFNGQACMAMAELNQAMRRIRDELGCKVLEVRVRTAPAHKRHLVLIEHSTEKLIAAGHGLVAARQPDQTVCRLLVDDVEVMWAIKKVVQS